MLKLLPISIILFLLPVAHALDYKNHCDNTSYLRKTMEFTSCEGNTCTDYNFTQLIECEFGCDNVTHNCRQPKIIEYSSYVIALFALLVGLGIMVKLWVK